jgi:hypothetical protein
VLANGEIVGRIFKVNAALVGEARGCGHWHSGTTKIARQPTATLQAARPR